MSRSERWGLLFLFISTCVYFQAQGWEMEISSIRTERRDSNAWQAQNNQKPQRPNL